MFTFIMRTAAIATIASLVLSGCSSGAGSGQRVVPPTRQAQDTYCPLAAGHVHTASTGLPCPPPGGDPPPEFPNFVRDLAKYVPTVPENVALDFSFQYTADIEVYVHEETPTSDFLVTAYDSATGQTFSTTFPANTTEPGGVRTQEVKCGLVCGWLVGKIFDYLWDKVRDPCSGDCGHLVYGVPTTPPPGGSQWYPIPMLIPTGGGFPPGWQQAPQSNGTPYVIPPIVNCPDGYYEYNCTGNPHNTIN